VTDCNSLGRFLSVLCSRAGVARSGGAVAGVREGHRGAHRRYCGGGVPCGCGGRWRGNAAGETRPLANVFSRWAPFRTECRAAFPGAAVGGAVPAAGEAGARAAERIPLLRPGAAHLMLPGPHPPILRVRQRTLFLPVVQAALLLWLALPETPLVQAAAFAVWCFGCYLEVPQGRLGVACATGRRRDHKPSR